MSYKFHFPACKYLTASSNSPALSYEKTARPTLFSGLRRRDLRTLLHPQKALDRILAAAVRSTRADSGSFILVNPNTGLLDIEASHGLSERAKRVKLRPGEGITGWVATTGKPLRTGDVREEKRYVSINAKVRSEMAVPVEMRGQVVGLLNVDSTNVDAFSATDEARLVDMASEAAQWLELAWEIDQLAPQEPAAHQPGRHRADDHFRNQPRRNPRADHPPDLRA